MGKKTVGILVGSLRQGSYCKRVALHLVGLLSGQYDVTLPDIGRLTFYNEDLDAEGLTPQPWLDFRREIRALDGVVFVTPEYNRSLTPVLKNAMDIASRPYGQNAWAGKPGAVVSVTPGRLGGFGANQALRQTAAFLNIAVMSQPEVYIADAAALTNEDGVTDEGLGRLLRDFAGAYGKWVEQITRP